MITKEILNFCIKKGLLIDNEVLSLFKDTEDIETVKLIIEKIKESPKKRILTKEIFYENKSKVREFLLSSSKGNSKLEKLRIKLGLSIEISRQKAEILDNSPKSQMKRELEVLDGKASFNQHTREETGKPPDMEDSSSVKILSMPSSFGKKIEVKDFVTHFRGRFSEMRNSLQEHSELNNLISINKISGNRQGISVIGMVYNKKITKNKNIMLEVEDLTGRIKVLINQNKQEVYKKAEDIVLDSVMGIKGSGNRDIIFANNVFFPESFLFERKKSPVEEIALFISDIHIGSNLFLEKNFLKFIDYLNGKIPNTPETDKIKYLFVVGDMIAGVGCYPNQERDLKIVDLEEQYSRAAELFGKIRKNIKIIMLPGNHDCVRLMEPQPILDERYAWPLYNLRNITLTTNPSLVNIGAKKNFPGFNVLAYHGFSFPYYAQNVPSLIKEKAINSPDKVMAYLLKNKHLAPTYASVQSAPSEKDSLMIREAPDIFVSGHTHKNGVSYYNNTLVISNSCWEDLMPYQEKMGFTSDYCKVPMFNLKTREVKILDFYDLSDEED